MKIILHCENNKSMQFEWSGMRGNEEDFVWREKGTLAGTLIRLWNEGIEICYDKSIRLRNITEQLHPISLEVIEEKECPECEGLGYYSDVREEDRSGNPIQEQVQCEPCYGTGKIEEVTSTTFFGDMKERDEEIFKKGEEHAYEMVHLGA